jgi:subtilisin
MQKRRIVPVSGITVLALVFIFSVGFLGSERAAAWVSGGSSTWTSSSVSSADLLARYVVVLKDGVDSSAVASLHALTYGAQVSHVYTSAITGYAATISTSAIAAIESDPDVLFVSEDGDVSAVGELTAMTQILPAGIDRIDADRSSTRAGDGRGSVDVNVAVLDTGIDPTHPDLNVVGGVDCTGGKGFDDKNGHGSHVAGTIAAIDNGFGVVGVAPGARLWSVRVLNKQGSGTLADLICGIDFVTATRTNSDPTDDIAVANMSLSAGGSDDATCGNTKKQALHRAICASVAAGTVYVAAAGNSGSDLQNSLPATYDEVLTVTAMTDFDGRPGGLATEPAECAASLPGAPLFSDDAAPFFSNFATLPSDQAHTIAAPGLCVLSTFVGGGYQLESGTSQATPHVAGTVALCIASGPCSGLTATQIVARIMSDAVAYNAGHPSYGFEGDPSRPISGKYYGALIRAAVY